jgi:hypothetical protein
LEWPKKLKRLLWTQKLKKKKKLRRVSQNTTPLLVNIIVRVSTVPENAKQLFKSGSFKIYEDQVKSDANAMVLDDTGKVLMNIVGGERIFSIEHTEKLVALSKKRQREANEEELESS